MGLVESLGHCDGLDRRSRYHQQSVLRSVALKLFSILVHAAGLEWVWSTILLTMSKARIKVNLERVLRCIHVKTSIRRVHKKIILKQNEAKVRLREPVRAIQLSLPEGAIDFDSDVYNNRSLSDRSYVAFNGLTELWKNFWMKNKLVCRCTRLPTQMLL